MIVLNDRNNYWIDAFQQGLLSGLQVAMQQKLKERLMEEEAQKQKELLAYKQELANQERNRRINKLFGYDTPTINEVQPEPIPNNPIDIQAQKMINPDYQQPKGLAERFKASLPSFKLGQKHVDGLLSEQFVNTGIPTTKDYIVAQNYGINLPKVEKAKPKVIKSEFIDLGDKKVGVAVVQNPDGSVSFQYDKEMVKKLSPKEREQFRLNWKKFKEDTRHYKQIEGLKREELNIKKQEFQQKQQQKKAEKINEKLKTIRNRIKDTIDRFQKSTGFILAPSNSDFTQLNQGEVQDIIEKIRTVNPDIAKQLERDYNLYYKLTDKVLGIEKQNQPVSKKNKQEIINKINKKLEEYLNSINQGR